MHAWSLTDSALIQVVAVARLVFDQSATFIANSVLYRIVSVLFKKVLQENELLVGQELRPKNKNGACLIGSLSRRCK